MTRKKLPVVGMRVTVYQVDSVVWPGKDEGVGLTGVVTAVEPSEDSRWDVFHVLPDSPDLSENDGGLPALDYSKIGWLVYNMHKWTREQYLIDELEIP